MAKFKEWKNFPINKTFNVGVGFPSDPNDRPALTISQRAKNKRTGEWEGGPYFIPPYHVGAVIQCLQEAQELLKTQFPQVFEPYDPNKAYGGKVTSGNPLAPETSSWEDDDDIPF